MQIGERDGEKRDLLEEVIGIGSVDYFFTFFVLKIKKRKNYDRERVAPPFHARLAVSPAEHAERRSEIEP